MLIASTLSSMRTFRPPSLEPSCLPRSATFVVDFDLLSRVFDSEDEFSDEELDKIVMIIETPVCHHAPSLPSNDCMQEISRPKKHDGKDRTGFHVSRAKVTAELADHIENELFYYEKVRAVFVGFLGTC